VVRGGDPACRPAVCGSAPARRKPNVVTMIRSRGSYRSESIFPAVHKGLRPTRRQPSGRGAAGDPLWTAPTTGPTTAGRRTAVIDGFLLTDRATSPKLRVGAFPCTHRRPPVPRLSSSCPGSPARSRSAPLETTRCVQCGLVLCRCPSIVDRGHPVPGRTHRMDHARPGTREPMPSLWVQTSGTDRLLWTHQWESRFLATVRSLNR
jgi:hypothetical protein